MQPQDAGRELGGLGPTTSRASAIIRKQKTTRLWRTSCSALRKLCGACGAARQHDDQSCVKVLGARARRDDLDYAGTSTTQEPHSTIVAERDLTWTTRSTPSRCGSPARLGRSAPCLPGLGPDLANFGQKAESVHCRSRNRPMQCIFWVCPGAALYGMSIMGAVHGGPEVSSSSAWTHTGRSRTGFGRYATSPAPDSLAEPTFGF